MSVLIRTDPFGGLDRLAQQVSGALAATGRPGMIRMDSYRDGDQFVMHFDLPGVSPESIDVQIERNVLTVRADRPAPENSERDMVAAERPYGTFTRHLFLDETLDTSNITASYEAGVLTLRIPVTGQATPRKIEITGGGRQQISAAAAG